LLSFRAGIVAALIVAAELGDVTAARAGDAPPRAHLDALWRQHMLAGTQIVAEFRKGEISTSDFVPTRPFESAHGSPERADSTRNGIHVVELGHGVWRNGGWVLTGGLLRRSVDGASTFELYGKAVVRRFSYFAFPFHRATPHETGYEFFLLHRRDGVRGATVVREWIFPPEAVVTKNVGGGVVVEDVSAYLDYDPRTRRATVAVQGLKQHFEEEVDLTSELLQK